ncbi:MAG: hypothetical protein M3P48_11675, partial [Actinomycetota bacterium]|nr:hypothetical protein [Actinomycetota bacterium]
MSDTPGWASPHDGDRGPQDQDGAPPPPPTPSAPGGEWGSSPQWAAQGPQWSQGYAAPPPKPGIIPLRPLGVGEILDGAITALRQNPKVMLGLSALVAAVTQLVVVPAQALLIGSKGDQAFSLTPTGAPSSSDLSLLSGQLTSAAITVVVSSLAVLLLTGILTVAVSRAVLGERIPVDQAWREAKPRLPAVAGVMLAVAALELGILLLAGTPALLLGLSGAGPGALVGAVALALLPALAAVVYVAVSFSLAPVAAVLERQPVGKALTRSRRLVRPNFWRIFGILLLVNILAQLLASVFAVPFVIVAMIVAYVTSDGTAFNLYDWGPGAIVGVGSALASAIAWPFTAVSTVLLYVDQRIRREGLDIELARAAAPGTPSATPATSPG